jgi:hypothetical protein
MKRTIVWRLTEAQKTLILAAIANCPTPIGETEEERNTHRAIEGYVGKELEKLGWNEFFWYLNANTRRKAKVR